MGCLPGCRRDPQPAPKGLLINYGDSSIDDALRFWIANPMDNGGICSEVRRAIWHAFHLARLPGQRDRDLLTQRVLHNSAEA